MFEIRDFTFNHFLLQNDKTAVVGFALAKKFLFYSFNGHIIIRYLCKTHTIRHFEHHCFFNSICFVFVKAVLLPLGINWVDWSAWENAFFEDSLPVMGVVNHNIKNLYYFPYSKFGPRKGHFFAFIPNYKLDKMLRWLKFILFNTFQNPFWPENDALDWHFLQIMGKFKSCSTQRLKSQDPHLNWSIGLTPSWSDVNWLCSCGCTYFDRHPRPRHSEHWCRAAR